MPDTIHPFPQSLPKPPATAVAGYVLVIRKMQPGSVVPPYKYDTSYHHYGDLQTAEEDERDYERGEYQGWECIGLFPVDRIGLPLARSVG